MECGVVMEPRRLSTPHRRRRAHCVLIHFCLTLSVSGDDDPSLSLVPVTPTFSTR